MSKRRKLKDNDKIVTIRPLAYYKMLIHILRFGNKARQHRNFKEVMGILIGHLEGEADQMGVKNVIVEDAVPISHGGSIEVAFAPEDYVSFSMVDAEYAERDPPMFSCGWYHSHPGLRIFFSATDINNQLGWQTPNSSAIGIVFDHTYLDNDENPGDLGFRTFRLDDPSKGSRSDYHEVKTIVEPPDNLEYYIKIMKLINYIHSKEPPILEINETLDPFGEINFPEKNQLLSKKPELKLTTIFSALQDGISNFLQLSVEPLISFFNNWSQAIIKKIMDNNLHIRSDLISIRDILSQGIDTLQNSFKFSLVEKLNEMDLYIDDRFEDFDKNSEKIKELTSLMKNQLIEQIDKLFEEKIKDLIDQKIEILDKSAKKLTEIDNKNIKTSENIKTQISSFETITENIISIEKTTLDSLKDSKVKIFETFKLRTDSILNRFTEFGNKNTIFSDEIETSISMLENSKKSLHNKISILETENQSLKKQNEQLKNDHKDLESENEDLLKKINKFGE